MSDFRNKIINEAVLPTMSNERIKYYTALVEEDGEGECKVSFSKNGKKIVTIVEENTNNNDSSPKKYYKKGEYILICENGEDKGNYTIVSKKSENTAADLNKYQLYQDIYSDFYYNTQPGYIY